MMDVIEWLLDSDPAIRWQVLRDLTDTSAEEVAAERERVEDEGWGGRLLAAEGTDGLWDGGALLALARRLPLFRDQLVAELVGDAR